MSRPFIHAEHHPNPRRRLTLRTAAAFLAMAGTLFSVQATFAQSPFPSKPITLIVPYPPGGTTDAQIRALATGAAKELGQPIVVANQPGVSGTLAPVEMARRSSPDGYTISMLPSSLLRLPHLSNNANWDPIADFTYIIGLTNYSFGIAVASDAPWQSLQELLADAKAHPSKFSFATSGNGGTGHINMSQLLKEAGVEMTFVPYKGVDLITAVIGRHVDVMVEAGWGGFVKSGQLRLLAVMTDERPKNWPQVPTVKELGYNVSSGTMFGIGGPKGMDPAVVKTLHDAFRKAADTPAYQTILDQENQPFTPMSSAEYASAAAEQFKREGEALKNLGIELQ